MSTRVLFILIIKSLTPVCLSDPQPQGVHLGDRKELVDHLADLVDGGPPASREVSVIGFTSIKQVISSGEVISFIGSDRVRNMALSLYDEKFLSPCRDAVSEFVSQPRLTPANTLTVSVSGDRVGWNQQFKGKAGGGRW